MPNSRAQWPILGRSDHIVKIGDIVEVFLIISFAVKDAMRDWEWLGIDRIEHLAFASNMEATFERWLQQPWHILYSALRCMACQEWQQQHVCPIFRKSDHNIGGGHNAWAYFDGCITHLITAPRCIGHLLNEDPLTGQGKSLIPSVATLLAELYPNKSTRECLPMLTIIYMAPGGHRQWPMSISALLDRLSWLVLQTRPLALSSFQAAVQKNQRWKPRYRCGPKVTVAPSTPIKFLDIGTKMDCYRIGDHIPGRDDTDNIFHPRFCG